LFCATTQKQSKNHFNYQEEHSLGKNLVAQKNKTFLDNYLFSIESIGKVYVPYGCYIMQSKTSKQTFRK
jgi:hypothetical protein